MPGSWLGDFSFWGTTYGLRTFKIFKSPDDLFIYFETMPGADFSFLSDIISRVFNSDAPPAGMEEVFHTDKTLTPGGFNRKVFVTGCFDMLHSGHIAFLQEAATYGDLYVSIGADENVHHLKGRFPVNTQDERKYMICLLYTSRCV